MARLFKIVGTCKGGGYRYCRTDPPHPKRNPMGLYPLHRVIAENKLGRLLKPGEIVHHKNHDKTDDRPGNLEVMTNEEHVSLHREKVDPVVFKCPVCGKMAMEWPAQFRSRAKKNLGGRVYCSVACGRKYRGWAVGSSRRIHTPD